MSRQSLYFIFRLATNPRQQTEASGCEIQMLNPKFGGFTKGFLVGISNPKDILFFSAFFPQFIQVM